jgi:hypothetical protein
LEVVVTYGRKVLRSLGGVRHRNGVEIEAEDMTPVDHDAAAIRIAGLVLVLSD